MKSTIVILLVIVLEALGYSYLLGEENEKLQAENAVMKQKILDQKSKINELNWYLAKIEMAVAVHAIKDSLDSKDVQDSAVPQNATADDDEENVIYLD